MQRVAPLGTVISFASTLDRARSLPRARAVRARPGARLFGFYLFSELHTPRCSADLRRLADLVAAGELDPQIDFVRPWSEAGRGDRGADRPPRGRQGRPHRR